jgi:hypothetical protein
MIVHTDRLREVPERLIEPVFADLSFCPSCQGGNVGGPVQ